MATFKTPKFCKVCGGKKKTSGQLRRCLMKHKLKRLLGDDHIVFIDSPTLVYTTQDFYEQWCQSQKVGFEK